MINSKSTFELTPDLKICRIINGMWQMAGGHGQINPNLAIRKMEEYHKNGFFTWDMADIYGPAEILFGQFRESTIKKSSDPESERCKIQGFTKFVPNPQKITRNFVQDSIQKSMKRMKVSSIDMLQFHWWDYYDKNYLVAIEFLDELQKKGLIKHLGLTNFDTIRFEEICQLGVKIVSNQTQYSILDRRPEIKLEKSCKLKNTKILAYGTLAGGFFSKKYLYRPEPQSWDLDTPSLQKYKNMIDVWGGWNLFQKLLEALDEISRKYNVSIANVAAKYILNKPEVAGVIIGTRLGISDNQKDNSKVFDFELDLDDIKKIEEFSEKSNDLFDKIGDCGDEYR